jgi:hypothetical protein
MAMMDGILYAVTTNTTNSALYRTLSPTTASSATTWDKVTAIDGASTNTLLFGQVPKSMEITSAHKVWVVDKGDTPTTNDNVFTLVDDIYGGGPMLSAPADAFVGAVNPVTGRAADVIFTWPRLSKSTAYGLEISYDDGFKEDVTTVTVTSSGSTVVQAVGPYQTASSAQQVELQPGTTYYWRVRTTSPIKSPYSETRSFTVASIDKPFSISGPVAGASNVGISPLMTWDEYPGATGYELALSEDPSFAIVEGVRNVANNFYSVPEELNYSTTY